MIGLFILLATFTAGGVAGYALRAFISHKRRVQYLQYSAYQDHKPRPAKTERDRVASFKNMNRAF